MSLSIGVPIQIAFGWMSLLAHVVRTTTANEQRGNVYRANESLALSARLRCCNKYRTGSTVTVRGLIWGVMLRDGETYTIQNGCRKKEEQKLW
ncbi:hypothetical protein BCV70DRAFT_126116 [Testicularia cyperi]|uniref:Secreted protein n=1 Tax=Testicularia cyperi TaxID=1882483 RepID=A0A317XLJ6_9BASI|nr:hypothetical protein BCV70DRAFT_126116 [Testicularia cyperi]